MSGNVPSRQQLDDLLEDLSVERGKLQALVESLREIAPTGDRQAADWQTVHPLWVDAAALRLQRLSTGIERCCVLIVRVFNGATPEGGDWHRRLLERMGFATAVRPAVLSDATVRGLGEQLRFRHVVRHLYAYELDAEQVRRLLDRAPILWSEVSADLERFTSWLQELRAVS
ncbi:MAG: hypothetical protein ER33_12640 [Cyanobium sp. CACIAM 14]|nr:MAG: hypothetical protein ER33_12640 [Cyanobium sp. CACIAM 14]